MAPEEIATGVVHDVPDDLKEALISHPDVLEKWNRLTPIARNEWICWVTIVKKSKQGKNISDAYAKTCSTESAGPAAGRVALTVIPTRENGLNRSYFFTLS